LGAVFVERGGASAHCTQIGAMLCLILAHFAEGFAGHPHDVKSSKTGSPKAKHSMDSAI
jgi:hypothetical protein